MEDSFQFHFPLAQVVKVFHEAILGSDHSPIVIRYCHPLKKSATRVFKFESKWITRVDCAQVIKNNRFSSQQESALFTWNTKNSSKLELSRDKARLSNMPCPLNINLQRQGEVIKEMETLLFLEEMSLHQLSRIDWLSYGDSNSRFFRASLIQRRQCNQLLRS